MEKRSFRNSDGNQNCALGGWIKTVRLGDGNLRELGVGAGDDGLHGHVARRFTPSVSVIVSCLIKRHMHSLRPRYADRQSARRSGRMRIRTCGVESVVHLRALLIPLAIVCHLSIPEGLSQRQELFMSGNGGISCHGRRTAAS